jgi:hypothetical protein
MRRALSSRWAQRELYSDPAGFRFDRVSPIITSSPKSMVQQQRVMLLQSSAGTESALPKTKCIGLESRISRHPHVFSAAAQAGHPRRFQRPFLSPNRNGLEEVGFLRFHSGPSYAKAA